MTRGTAADGAEVVIADADSLECTLSSTPSDEDASSSRNGAFGSNEELASSIIIDDDEESESSVVVDALHAPKSDTHESTIINRVLYIEINGGKNDRDLMLR